MQRIPVLFFLILPNTKNPCITVLSNCYAGILLIILLIYFQFL